MTTTHQGELEIDHDRGVIYFHSAAEGRSILRICRLGKIPYNLSFVDLTGPFPHQSFTEGTI